MKNHHKRRSMHRAAAFTQAQPKMVEHPIATDYEAVRPLYDLMQKRTDRITTRIKHFIRDRHPITLEKLDGE